MDEIQPQSDLPSPTKKRPSKKKERRQKQLTIKQKLWIKHYFKKKNASEAARLAGYKANPAAIGCENKIKLNKNELFLAELAKAGLTDESLLAPVHGALSATVYATSFGEVKPSNEPDHHTRLKAAEMGLKLLGRLGKDDEEKAGPVVVQIVNYGPTTTIKSIDEKELRRLE